MTLRFEDPWWLVLAAAGPLLGAMALLGFSAMAPLRRWSAALCRVALMVLLAAMLAGATLIKPVDRLAVIALVDVSGSVRSLVPPHQDVQGGTTPPVKHVAEQLRRIARQRGPDDLLGVIAFDGGATVLAAPTTADALTGELEAPPQEGTDIAAAIRTAMLLFPPDASRRILLISDGVATRGQTLAAARDAAGARTQAGGPAGGRPTPIDVVPMAYDSPREVLVEMVDVPARAPAGAVITARVALLASSPVSGTLRLTAEDKPVMVNGRSSQRVDLKAGRNVVLLGVPLGPGRVHKIEATFEPDPVPAGAEPSDTVAANNRAEAFVVTPGAGGVLIIDGVGDATEQSPAQTLARVLRRENMKVDLASPGATPTDLLRLQAYDAVLLQNVPADSVSSGAQQALVRYVTELGGGLVMIGGPDSFGAGGWKGTAIEPILPVRLDLPERLVIPSAAVVFVIDTSGSMAHGVLGSARSQQDIANLGAATAIRSMDKSDLVGLIEFNSGYDVVFKLGPNTDAEANAREALALAPGGGTNMPPALEEAYRQLIAAKAQNKHIIVLSDGVSRGKNRLPAIADAMKAAAIRVSSIAVGDEADTDGLAMLAERTGGEFYRVRDPNTLPRIFVKAVRLVRSPMIREEPFVPAVLSPGSALVDGMDTSSMPPLGGLTLTQPRTGKDAAETVSVNYVMATAEGEPVLAHWQAGLGQVAAFTSDAHKWAVQWVDWPGYSRMWTQIVRAVSRAPASRTSDLAVEFDGDRVRVRLESTDERGSPMEGLVVRGSLFAPGGERAELRLTQTGPGVYQASVPSPGSMPGNYVVTLTPRTAGVTPRALEPVVGGVVRPAGEEYRVLRADRDLLERVARETGGRVLNLDDPKLDARTLFDRSGVRRQEARTPLWPWLMGWAIVAMLLDVGTRRIAWDRLLSGKFGSSLTQRAARAVRDRSAQAAGSLASLRQSGVGEPAQPSAAALGEADAAALAAEAKKRRRAERAANVAERSEMRGPNAAPAPESTGGGAAPVVISKPAPAEDSAAGGLMAAKRRAREQMDEGKSKS